MAPAPMAADSPPMEHSQAVPPDRVVFPEVLPLVGFRGRVGFQVDRVLCPVVDSQVRSREGREASRDRFLPEVSRGRFPVVLGGRLRMARVVFRVRLLAEVSRGPSPVVLRMGRFREGLAASRAMARPVERVGFPAVLPLERCRAEGRGSRVVPPVERAPGQAPADFPALPPQGECRAMPWPRVAAPWVALRVAWVALREECQAGWGRWEPLAECPAECPGEPG